MNTPPVLTGDRRTDRALVALARLLAEIAASAPGEAAAEDRTPAADEAGGTREAPAENLVIRPAPPGGRCRLHTRTRS